MADNLSDPVPITSIKDLNRGLSSAKEATMVAMMGAPREPLTTTCQNDRASPDVTKLLETRRITPNFRLSGITPALDSVQAIFAKVSAAHPELIAQLSTEGMICVRHRKPTSGAPSKQASNHSWGTAVDFKLIGHEAPGNSGTVVPRWVAILVPFFNQAGWFSGIDFKDDMHFEVADETIRQWKKDGKLDPPKAGQPAAVA
jgi:D-alanyl-D-alanine carboxypeptidase